MTETEIAHRAEAAGKPQSRDRSWERFMRRNLPPEAADRNLAWLRARATPSTAEQARTWSSLQGG